MHQQARNWAKDDDVSHRMARAPSCLRWPLHGERPQHYACLQQQTSVSSTIRITQVAARCTTSGEGPIELDNKGHAAVPFYDTGGMTVPLLEAGHEAGITAGTPAANCRLSV